jgi:hypothetical protein
MGSSFLFYPGQGVTAAFIEDNGAPVEFLQIDPEATA